MFTVQEILRYSGEIYLTDILCTKLHRDISTDKRIPFFVKQLLEFEPDKSKKSDRIVYVSEYCQSDNSQILSLHSISKKDLLTKDIRTLAHYPNNLIIFDLNRCLQYNIYYSELLKMNTDYFIKEILKRLYFCGKGLISYRGYINYEFNPTSQLIELKQLKEIVNN